jgi:hypothetical protein
MLFKRASKKKMRLKEEQRELGLSIGPLKASRKRVYEPSGEDETIKGQESPIGEAIREVPEREVIIKPGEYELISLGHLAGGALVDFHVKEIYGLNISVFVMDKENVEKYHETGVTRGAIWQGSNLPEHADSIRIGRPAEYFIVITSRAIEKNRRVWLKVNEKS